MRNTSVIRHKRSKPTGGKTTVKKHSRKLRNIKFIGNIEKTIYIPYIAEVKTSLSNKEIEDINEEKKGASEKLLKDYKIENITVNPNNENLTEDIAIDESDSEFLTEGNIIDYGEE